MENVKGPELLELLNSGDAVLSEDRKTIIHKSTNGYFGESIPVFRCKVYHCEGISISVVKTTYFSFF